MCSFSSQFEKRIDIIIYAQFLSPSVDEESQRIVGVIVAVVVVNSLVNVSPACSKRSFVAVNVKSRRNTLNIGIKWFKNVKLFRLSLCLRIP